MLISKRVGASLCVAVVVAIAGCQSQPSSNSQNGAPVANAQGEANKATLQRVYDVVFGQGDTTAVDSLMAESFTEHAVLPGLPPTREGLKQFVGMTREGFPDFKFEVNHMSADGDLVWAHVTMTGTNNGPFMGSKATGKAIKVETFDLVRFENGRAVEHWGLTDDAAMMRQLGIAGGLPAAEKTGKGN